MNWLLVTILSYFFLALVALFDRYFLIGPLPDPWAYTFYIGILWLFVSLPLIFFGPQLQGFEVLVLGILTGLIRIFAILFLAKGISESEISRVVPAIGGFLPIFTFLFFSIFLPQTELFTPFSLLAFFLLLLGSVLISLKEFSFRIFNFKNLKYPTLSAFLFAVNFFLTKILYLKTNFITGFFLILVGGGIGAILFLVFPKVRGEIFRQRPNLKLSGFFLLGQAMGGLGVLCQFYALFLAKPYQVPLINALEGIRYVFLLLFVFLLSIWKPHLLQEEIKGKILYQKIFAVISIGVGLTILALQK